MPSSDVRTDVASALVARLPEVAYTKSGLAFQPNDDVWAWADGPFRVHLDFTRLDLPSSIPVVSLKHALLVYAKTGSPNHLSNLFNAFVHFLAVRTSRSPLVSIDAAEVANYAAKLQPQERWRLATLNGLLQRWGTLGLEGVEQDCTQYLRERRKPGNEKGAAVRTRDPIEGPFSEAEYTALYKAADAAYGAGDLKQWVLVLTRLLFACGGRISQYASLKVKDFVVREDGFCIDLPQAKTRERHLRVLFKRFDLSPQTGRFVQEYISYLAAKGHGPEAPLFPYREVMTHGPRKERHPRESMFYGHCLRSELSSYLSVALGEIAPPTERLQFETMPITPQRFRYTFGTRLVEEGASKTVVADRLGHVDLQHVDVYYEASPKIVENIDKAMAAQLAPLARAFRGHLVEDEEHTTHKGAPGSRIIDFRIATVPVGSCGGKGQGCAFNKPVACYTCFKFEPWLDAPHEKVLQRLQQDREHGARDERLAAINDNAILAVQEVIAECAGVHAQRAEAAQ